MTARIRRIPSRDPVRSLAFRRCARRERHRGWRRLLRPSSVEVSAPTASKLSALTGAATLARPGTALAPAAAAQGASSNGGGPIVGLWQVLMTAFPGTSNEFIFDFGFQQFHSDGTELMISGGVPPTHRQRLHRRVGTRGWRSDPPAAHDLELCRR